MKFTAVSLSRLPPPSLSFSFSHFLDHMYSRRNSAFPSFLSLSFSFSSFVLSSQRSRELASGFPAKTSLISHPLLVSRNILSLPCACSHPPIANQRFSRHDTTESTPQRVRRDRERSYPLFLPLLRRFSPPAVPTVSLTPTRSACLVVRRYLSDE